MRNSADRNNSSLLAPLPLQTLKGFQQKNKEDYVYKAARRCYEINKNEEVLPEKEEVHGTAVFKNGVRITKRLRTGSIHTPLSVILMRMEYEGTKQKLKQSAKNQGKTKVFQCLYAEDEQSNEDNTFLSMSYSKTKTCTSSVRITTSQNKNRNIKSTEVSTSSSDRHISPEKNANTPHLIEGTFHKKISSLPSDRPKLSQILTPISHNDHNKQNLNCENDVQQSYAKNSREGEEKTANKAKCMSVTNIVDQLLYKLLGSSELRPANKKASYKSFGLSDGTNYSETENSHFIPSPSVVAEDACNNLNQINAGNHQERNLQAFNSRNNHELSSLRNDLYNIDAKSKSYKKYSNQNHIKTFRNNDSNVAGINRREIVGTSDECVDKSNYLIKGTGAAMLNKRTQNINQQSSKQRNKGTNLFENVQQIPSQENNLKLSNMKRNLVYIDSGLGSLKNRKDKTPYRNNISMTTWLTPFSSDDMNGTCSESSVNTPSDNYLRDRSFLENEKNHSPLFISSSESLVSVARCNREMSESVLTPEITNVRKLKEIPQESPVISSLSAHGNLTETSPSGRNGNNGFETPTERVQFIGKDTHRYYPNLRSSTYPYI